MHKFYKYQQIDDDVIMDQQQVKTPVVALRMPEPLIRRVDQYSEGRCVGRAEAIRRLVEAGLKREEVEAA